MVVFDSPSCIFIVKRTILTGALALIAIATIAATATLQWTPSASTSVAKQTLYTGVAVNSYTGQTILPPNITQYQVLNLVTGATYHFSITVTDSNNLSSAFSTEAVYTVPIPTNAPPTNPPAPVTGLHVVGP